MLAGPYGGLRSARIVDGDGVGIERRTRRQRRRQRRRHVRRLGPPRLDPSRGDGRAEAAGGVRGTRNGRTWEEAGEASAAGGEAGGRRGGGRRGVTMRSRRHADAVHAAMTAASPRTPAETDTPPACGADGREGKEPQPSASRRELSECSRRFAVSRRRETSLIHEPSARGAAGRSVERSVERVLTRGSDRLVAIPHAAAIQVWRAALHKDGREDGREDG